MFEYYENKKSLLSMERTGVTFSLKMKPWSDGRPACHTCKRKQCSRKQMNFLHLLICFSSIWRNMKSFSKCLDKNINISSLLQMSNATFPTVIGKQFINSFDVSLSVTYYSSLHIIPHYHSYSQVSELKVIAQSFWSWVLWKGYEQSVFYLL